jgi:RHS repeat-associated protein
MYSSGKNVFRYPSGVSYEFSGAGQLTARVDSDGRRHEISYESPNAYGGTTTVQTSPEGRVYRVLADGLDRIREFVDAAGEKIVYDYDSAGRLWQVTYPDLTPSNSADNPARQYLYEDVRFPTFLTAIIDENGERYASWVYDDSGRAVSSEHANGVERVTLEYVDANTTKVREYKDASGYLERIFRHSVRSQPPYSQRRVTSIEYSHCPDCGLTGHTETYSYDGWAMLKTTVDRRGVVTEYEHETERGLEKSRTEAKGTPIQRTTTTVWHSSYLKPHSITRAGKRTSFTFDTKGNFRTRTETDTTITPNLARTWTYTYNAAGRVLTSDGPRTDVSDITTYTYYSCNTGYECGQVHTATNALGHVTTYNSYNAHGQPLTITDPNGVVTTFTYDLRQRLTSRAVGAEVTSFDYWPTGLLKKATLPDGSYLEYTYDAAHRLTDINDSEGNRIHYTLDAMGNRTAEEVFDPSNALVQTRTRVFNTLNQLHKEIGAAGGTSVTTTFGYDNNGNRTDIDAPLGRSTNQTYDELNRLTSVTDPAGGITQYGYNALDQLMSVTDPRGKVTSYEYNALGDLLEQVSPDTGTTVFTYDSAGNVKTRTDARGKTATYTYDALNRVTSVSYPDQTITYVYDTGTNQKGRLTQVTDNSGSTSWTYDAQGRVLSREQTMGSVIKTLGYSYDAAGRLDTLTLPSGNTITYSYTNGKVTSLTLNGSTTILSNALYQPFGPTTGWTWGNSTLAVREYDLDGKITDLDSAGLKSYGYDDAFRITSIADATDPSLSQSYGYDLVDRLTSATGTNVNQSWTYDANGNRLTQGGSDPSTYTISSTSNRINSITGSLSRTYGYDAAGNKTSDGVATYSYDDAGRMVSASKSGVSATYSLNALGQRVKKTVAGVSTYFVYDESGHLVGEYDASGNLQQETIWFGDAPVGVLKSNGSGVDLFYIHTDHLNTPRRISRPSDNLVVWRWDSDPFGTTAAIEDADGDSKVFLYNLRFPGQYYDSESGLHYNYFRDYEPATGRYVQSDPMGLRGGLNTYTYALNRPTQLVDSTGLCSCSGGTWRVDFGDLNLSLAFGGYTSFGVVSFTCKSNPSTKCQAYMWCVGGGVMVGAGATISLLGRVNGAPNSQNLQGWSGWQATGSVGPAVGQADGSSGGSVGSGISLGAGLAAIKCNTFSMNCQCNCEK